MAFKKTKNVCLVMPSTLASYTAQKLALPPMGLLSIARPILESNRNVTVIDSILEGFDCDVPIDHNFYLLGLPPKDLARRILSSAPDVVGFSMLFSTQRAIVQEVCKIIRAEAPEIFVFLGGAIPTLQPKTFLKDKYVDGLILSEADNVIVPFLDVIEKAKETPELPLGCGVRTKNGFKLNSDFEVPKDIDALGFPAREIVDMEAYIDVYKKYMVWPKQFPATTIITSRGCPLRCTFCTSKHINTRHWRALSPEKVLSEIDMLVEKYGIKELQIIDENFTANPKRAERIMDLLIERDYGLSWHMTAGTYVMTLNERLIEKMYRAGLYKMKVSFESGSERVLRDMMDKPIDLEYGEKMMRFAKSIGLPIGSAFIIGYPWETKEDIHASLDFAKRVDFDFTHWAFAAPYPKTELTRREISEGVLPEDFDDLFEERPGGTVFFDLPDVSREDLISWRYDFWRELHFSSSEKQARFEGFNIPNPDFRPMEPPSANQNFKSLSEISIED